MRIEEVMTPREMRDSGVSTLSAAQKDALNKWLWRYSLMVHNLGQTSSLKASVPAPVLTPTPHQVRGGSGCSPAIESSISGDFEGWTGETIFKLANGQIWQQAEYDYEYNYDYSPTVTIYQTRSGCRMKVEGEDETILVKRIK